MSKLVVIDHDGLTDPSELTLIGVFQLATDATVTQSNQLRLLLNYLTPQVKRNGSAVKMLARAILPLTDPVAAEIAQLELKRGEYVYVIARGYLEYERRQATEGADEAVFATFRFESIERLQRVASEPFETTLQERAARQAERQQQAQARRDGQPAESARVARAVRAPRAPVAAGARSQPADRAAIETEPTGWSDHPTEPVDEDDPFADIDFGQDNSRG